MPEQWKRLEQVKGGVVELRSRGLSAVSVNTYLRHVNAYFIWRGKAFTLRRLREEQKLISTFTPEQVGRIVNGRPAGRKEARVRMIAVTALDTGMKIEEMQRLRRTDVDFDHLTFRVQGKGNKQRLVPMSIELRKLLFRYWPQGHADRLFCTARGTQPTQRNLLRDFKRLCGRLGIEGVRCSFRTLRHTFACEYLRRGGNLEYLRRILGHSKITTTEQYLRILGIADLQAAHNDLSILSGRR